MTSTIALSSAGVSCMSRPITPDLTCNKNLTLTSSKPFISIKKGRAISCEVALRSNNSSATAATTTSTSSTISEEDEKDKEELLKVGKKVRVKAPLKVYHVPRVPEVDLSGKEGVIKQYVGVWKGKKISANLPYKVEFVLEVEGRGPVKVFAHLKEDEFEYLD